MRVLHIVWNLIRGGTEGQCARTALALNELGVQNRVAVFRKEGYFLPRVEEKLGAVYEWDIRRMFSSDTVRKIFELKQWIRQESFDVIHAWDADAEIFGAFAARWAGIPYITSRRDLGEIYPAHKKCLMRSADRHANAVVVNAEAIRKTVRAKKIVKIPNILDVEEFDRLAMNSIPGILVGGASWPREERGTGMSRPQKEPAQRCVGMIARLDSEKDGETYVRVAERVTRGFKDVIFVVAGDGRERAKLEALARQLNIVDKIIFVGEINNTPALIRRLHVGVLVPKANEGLSNTILEYMAGRLPVVATDCGGNRELVEEGRNGFIRAIGDIEGVAKAVISLLEDEEAAKKMGEQGREKIEKGHQPRVIAEQFKELYESI